MLETFSIKTKAGLLDHTSRNLIVREFFERLEPYMSEEVSRNRACAVFFEDLYVTGGPRRGADKLIGRAKVAGVLEHMLEEANLPAFAVAPHAMTSFLLGKAPRKREDKKKAVMDWLHHNRNFFTTNDNQADAYGLAEFGYAYLIEGQRLTCRALYSAI